jgi:glutamate transport system permease protein
MAAQNPPIPELTATAPSAGNDLPLSLPMSQRRGPLFTVANGFSALGWLILAVLAIWIVIPAILHGNWEPFKLATTWEFLAKGLLVTLKIGALSIVISSAVGFVLALGRLSNAKVVAWFSAGYIELMRALPSYLIIFYVFIVLPRVGIALPTDWYAVIGLSLYTSAVMAEIFRAGILSVEKGQLEAAYSLGLKPYHTVTSIILPQALRRMVPAIVSQLITLTKDTSLAAIIAVHELTRAGKELYEFYTGEMPRPVILETLAVVAAIYFVICYALALLSQRLEVKQGR